MAILPKALQSLIEALEVLPGVGPRSAERYAYYLFKSSEQKSAKLENALKDLHKNITYCPVTFALISKDQEVSPLYADPSRDKQVIAVVADPFDIIAIEKTGFKGTYHVLGGLISPIDGITPEKLHINELIERIKKDKTTELILATSASVEGESTALFIADQLKDTKVTVSRLARGLPIGLDLEYADHITLSRALEGRQTI